MKFLSVRDLKTKGTEVWQALAAEHEMVVTSNGRPIAILSAVSKDTLEETLAAIRRAKAVVAVAEIQRRSIEHGAADLSPEALTQLEEDLRKQLKSDEILSLEVKAEQETHPMLRFAGVFEDDPLFDEVMEEIEAYRREIDADEGVA